jgi:hypothetical protein
LVVFYIWLCHRSEVLVIIKHQRLLVKLVFQIISLRHVGGSVSEQLGWALALQLYVFIEFQRPNYKIRFALTNLQLSCTKY